MSAKGGVYVTGSVLDVEHKSGNQGTDKSYSFHIVSILAGKTVVEVKFDQRNCTDGVPKDGQEVTVRADLSVYSGRLQVNAREVMPAPSGVRAAS